MNKATIKRKIIVLKLVDYTLFFLVLGVGVPAIFMLEQTLHRMIAALITLAGFGIVSQVGGYCHHRIAVLEVEIDKLNRLERQRRR